MHPEPVLPLPSNFDLSATSPASVQQLTGRQTRLERELAQAFGMQPWPGALIERLADELLETGHALEKSGRSAG